MNTTPFPYSISADTFDKLQRAYEAAHLLANLSPSTALSVHSQLSGAISTAGLIAAELDQIIIEVNDASTLPMPSGEGQADAR